MDAQQEHVIANDSDELQDLYDAHKDDVWCGYNSRSYDQYILKGILLGFNPKEINDWIIVRDLPGWRFSNLFNKIPLINYDTMPNPPVGLKTMEAFMGNDIRESSVPFNIDRKLTPEEIAETVKYCRHDVEQTVEVFLERKSEFEAMFDMCKMFNLPLSYIGNTDAGILAKVLDCVKTERNDEFDFQIEPFIKLEKYKSVYDWFRNAKSNCIDEMRQEYAKAPKSQKYKFDWKDPERFKKHFYNRSIETVICGIPHIDGWGGIHGATSEPIYRKGAIYHVDVGSYYPSYLIAHNRITRSARKPEKYVEVYETRMQLKAAGKKKEQAPYKKFLNALSGAMKDPHNPAFDPCMNNTMVVNCQLMLIMLLEQLEKIPGFELLQSNTDGLIIQIPDTEEAFNALDDTCYAWEQKCGTDRCKITLAFDNVEYIFQKDVNNYLFKFADSEKVERKGAYVKELSRLDNDLPIVNKALTEYMIRGIHPAVTINGCTELIEFQKVVKLSGKYEYVHHNGQDYSYKSYRVFASNDSRDGKILKCRSGSNPAKFGNTPDSCFIDNTDINGKTCPAKLDKKWYIDLAVKRLEDFGVRL